MSETITLSNREKMLNGKYYDSWDASLVTEREQAKKLLFRFNACSPESRQTRSQLIHELIPNSGDSLWIESPFSCDYGTNIKLGENFYSNTNCTILDCANVTIGDNVLFGPNVSIYTPNHAFDPSDRNSGLERSLPVEIGDNVWVGGSVSVLSGVEIGDNSIIGAGSVVTKSIPADVIAVGNPCKVVRRITEADNLNLED